MLLVDFVSYRIVSDICTFIKRSRLCFFILYCIRLFEILKPKKVLLKYVLGTKMHILVSFCRNK